jgi:hypothetical protein
MSVTIHNIATDIVERNRAYKHYVEYADIYQDKNRHLYDKLWDRLDEYSMFLIAYEDDIPLGMGGVNTFYWKQSGVARVMDRAFQFKRSMNFTTMISSHILKPQIDWCIDNNIHTVFMSMESRRRMEFYQRYYVDKKIDYNFELQPHLYNVCGQTEYINCDDSCWQPITVCYLSDDRSFILPYK